MPDRVGVRDFEINALIALDSVDVAIRSIDAAMSLPEERDAANFNALSILAGAAAELRAHGHTTHAVRLTTRLIETAHMTDVESMPLAVRESVASSLLKGGADSAAFAIADRLAASDTARFPSIPAAGDYGVAAARLGDTPAAERALQRIDALAKARQPFTSGSHLTAGARIAAALGRNGEALRLATAAAAVYGRGFRIAAHSLPEFSSLRRNPEFQRLLKSRDD